MMNNSNMGMMNTNMGGNMNYDQRGGNMNENQLGNRNNNWNQRNQGFNNVNESQYDNFNRDVCFYNFLQFKLNLKNLGQKCSIINFFDIDFFTDFSI